MMKGVASGVAYEVDLFEFAVPIIEPTFPLISLAKKSLKLELVELLVNLHSLSAKEAKIKVETFLEMVCKFNWVSVEMSFKKDLNSKLYRISDSCIII